ncbi:iron-containing alcohol dehydrogenase [Bacillus sp. PK3_68]|uniref:iron-containing alcohol dehydrogenase n=1 Tax=Bacillus sp. PK3_68 TaxID=2027408 RepID=UPI00217F1934|nr:iron-containing alcohol dehydrogenase [Bacillus sp. PK3_68]
MRSLSKAINIPTLEEAGVKREQFEQLAKATLNEEISTMVNPREVNEEEVMKLLELAYSARKAGV